MLRIFTPVKIQRLRPGLNPQIWVPEASMLTTRPPKPSIHKLSTVSPTSETNDPISVKPPLGVPHGPHYTGTVTILARIEQRTHD